MELTAQMSSDCPEEQAGIVFVVRYTGKSARRFLHNDRKEIESTVFCDLVQQHGRDIFRRIGEKVGNKTFPGSAEHQAVRRAVQRAIGNEVYRRRNKMPVSFSSEPAIESDHGRALIEITLTIGEFMLGLSEQDNTILQMMMAGCTLSEIAAVLGMSVSWVGAKKLKITNLLANILGK
jgi:DNA-binding NarL/FixJ family response regulator